MPIFHFEALDLSGTAHRGQLEAATPAALIEALRARQWIVTRLQRERAARFAGWRRARASAHLSSKELGLLVETLATLLGAGLQLDRSLQIARTLAPDPHVAAHLARLAESVRAGASLRASWSQTEQPLPRYFLSLVEAGEESGQLSGSLARIAALMRYELEVRERIRAALLYPAILVAVILVTLGILLGFVLPRFEVLFAESDADLPWMTVAVIALGRWVSDYAWILLLALVAGLILLRRYLASRDGKRRRDAWLLDSKLMLGLPGAIQTAQLFHSLSILLSSGLPLSAAMRVASGTLGNECLRDAFLVAAQRVNAGSGFGESLALTKRFPAVAVQMAHVGEETGDLPALLASTSALLEREARLRIDFLLTTLVPAMTVVMGLIVAALVGSVLIGLLSLNDLAA